MAQTLVIEGIPPYDGEYPLKWDSPPTNREGHEIKKMTGVRLGELQEAMAAGDSDVIVALTYLTLKRLGHNVNVDALWDAPIGAIDVRDDGEPEPELGDARPPDSPTTGGGESKSAVESGPSSESALSGSGGTETGASSQPLQSPTGSPGSEGSAA